MGDREHSTLEALSRFFQAPAGLGMNTTTFICMLGLLDLYTIMTTVQDETSVRSQSSTDAPAKTGTDAQALMQSLAGIMSGQGGGQKMNPAALLSLMNMLASQLEKGPQKAESKPAEDSAPPAKTEYKSELRRVPADGPQK